MALRNIQLRDRGLEPKDAAWKAAGADARKLFWQRVADYTLSVKRDEIRRGIGVDGDQFLPVKKASRPDGATGKPLDPHYAESRTYRLLASHVTASGATIFWRAHGRVSWTTILGYHADGMVIGAPVRDTIGLSKAGWKKVAGEAKQLWQRQTRGASPAGSPPRPAPEPPPRLVRSPRPTPAAPVLAPVPAPAPMPLPVPSPPRPRAPRPEPVKLAPRPPRAAFTGAQRSPNPSASKIQIFTTPGPGIVRPPATPGPAPKPRPTPKPKAPPAPAVVATPTPSSRAVEIGAALGIKIEPNGHAFINAAHKGGAVNIVNAMYDASTGTIYLNEQQEVWHDSERMATFRLDMHAAGWSSTGAADHTIHHEIGHALHHRASPTHFANLHQLAMQPEHVALAAAYVSRYAATKPLEFVAEVYVGLRLEKPYPESVMRLYRRFGGPIP